MDIDNSITICESCKNIIDPTTCGCGGPIDHSELDGHSPIPLGCNCGRDTNNSKKTTYTEEELSKWWLAYCPVCLWVGLSRDTIGGEQIADTGDYSDCYCPVCIKSDEYVVVCEDVFNI